MKKANIQKEERERLPFVNEQIFTQQCFPRQMYKWQSCHPDGGDGGQSQTLKKMTSQFI